MATNSQYLNGQLSDAQIEQLIQSLRGIKPVENDILNAEKTVNKEKMASYAEILKDDGKENENTNTNINTKSNSSSEKVKPIFLKDEDVFGSSMKPARSLWLTNVEIYKAIEVRVPSQCIKGILLTCGNDNLTYEQNCIIFKYVFDYIKCSKRFLIV